MPRKTSKDAKVKSHLIKHKSITSWQAIEKYAATRLSDIVFRLKKKGWQINTEMIEFTDKYKNKGHYAKYVLISTPKTSALQIALELK